MHTLELIALESTENSAIIEDVLQILLSRLVHSAGLKDATLVFFTDEGDGVRLYPPHPLPRLRGRMMRVPAAADHPPGWRACDARGEAAGKVHDKDASHAPQAQAPVALGGRILGDLRLTPPDTPAGVERAAALVEPLARHCALLVQRHAVRDWTAARLGRPWLMAGMSPGIRALDTFIERAAPSPLPVLLRGHYGTETSLVAASLHARAPWCDGPLVPLDGSDPDGAPAQWLARAAGGTLVLNDVDALPPAWQARLARHLGTLPPLGLAAPANAPPLTGNGAPPDAPPPARVIATTTVDLEERQRRGAFSRPLWDWLSCLTAEVPPLKARQGDMRALLAAALDRHGHTPAERLDDALVQAAQAYHWPENWLELDRLVARLAVLAAGPRIGRRDIALHAPTLAPLLPPEPRPAPAAPTSPARLPTDMPDIAAGEGVHVGMGPDRWVALALRPDPRDLGVLHPGLRRALVYLGRSYAEPVFLPQVAEQAHVSASHLRLLFRRDLGLSCKALLNRIRVRQAQTLLRDQPRLPVTEVALQAGFADLSHFERSFRRLVGQSPREYRRMPVN